MMWRLLLAQAHVQCVGSKYDEAVITQTMQVLAPRMASRHTQRIAVPASVQVHLREASTRDAAVAAWPLAGTASLADFGVDAPQSVAQWVREAARASKPLQLPDEMASAIAAANRQGYTKALPADIAQLHGLQHGLAGSRLREMEREQAWALERKRLLAADELSGAAAPSGAAASTGAAASSGAAASKRKRNKLH